VVIVYLLPLALAGAIALVAPAYTNGGAHVVGVDPDRPDLSSRRSPSDESRD
jgi:hypothetical protein